MRIAKVPCDYVLSIRNGKRREREREGEGERQIVYLKFVAGRSG